MKTVDRFVEVKVRTWLDVLVTRPRRDWYVDTLGSTRRSNVF